MFFMELILIKGPILCGSINFLIHLYFEKNGNPKLKHL